MKVAELLERRRKNWRELELLCDQVKKRRRKSVTAADMTRFGTLYRAACADLALADSYGLPPNTVQYLHRLVGRAHNQMYRSRKFDLGSWTTTLLLEVPQRIFNDRCVQLCFVVFWGFFILSAWLAYSKAIWPDFAESMIGQEQITQMETSFANEMGGRESDANFVMAGFYIQHNTTIGLKCFAGGLLILPGLAQTLFNASFLGAAFGYMARPEVDQGRNFFNFVTAHGPFELTAIVLSAGAGLRLGVAWLFTNGFTRTASLVKTAKEAMPIMGAAMMLFFLAALIEGFVSPSGLPYWFKACVAVMSSGLLMFYFAVLGFPNRDLLFSPQAAAATRTWDEIE